MRGLKAIFIPVNSSVGLQWVRLGVFVLSKTNRHQKHIVLLLNQGSFFRVGNWGHLLCKSPGQHLLVCVGRSAMNTEYSPHKLSLSLLLGGNGVEYRRVNTGVV